MVMHACMPRQAGMTVHQTGTPGLVQGKSSCNAPQQAMHASWMMVWAPKVPPEPQLW